MDTLKPLLQRKQQMKIDNRILIIESDDGLRISLARLLRREQFEVFSVANLDQANTYLNEMMINCVIFGLNQPYEESISQLTAIVCHKQKPNVLVLSSFDWLEVQRELKGIDIKHFLTKPIKQEQLIKQLLEHKRTIK